MRVVCGVRIGVAFGCVGTRGEGAVSSGGVFVWLTVEELNGRIVAGSTIGFLENSGKTSHTVSHSRLISAKSVCMLAWKESVVKVIEALGDQSVGRSVGGSKGLNMVCKLAAFIGVSSKVLMSLLLGYEGKNVLVSGSAEPVGARWVGEKANR